MLWHVDKRIQSFNYKEDGDIQFQTRDLQMIYCWLRFVNVLVKPT